MKFNRSNIKRRHVDSSAIISLGYDPESRVLQIEFISQDIYNYFDVPAYIYEDMMQADSIGSFFNKHVLNQYEYELLVQHKKAG